MADELDPFILDLAEELEYNFTYKEIEEILNKKGKFQIPLQWAIYFGGHEFRNTAAEIAEYFSTPERPVCDEEMIEFWQSLTIRERIEFKDAEF